MNLVEGAVEQLRAGDKRPVKAKQPENGDSISVSESGRSEILLTPGYCMRGRQHVTFLDCRPRLKIRSERRGYR